MCGRFSQTKSKQEIKKRFNAKNIVDGIVPIFNIVPGHDVRVILNSEPDVVTFARWGLLPSWAKEEKTPYKMINARAETLLEKPSYKRLVNSRRCLIIADSFYEWKIPTILSKDSSSVGEKKIAPAIKTPYRILLKDESLFCFAGLWDHWEKDGKNIISCSIITTSPNKLVAAIHDRMPVILDQKEEKTWLSGTSLNKVLNMLDAYDADQMKAYPIATAINNPLNDDISLITPA